MEPYQGPSLGIETQQHLDPKKIFLPTWEPMLRHQRRHQWRKAEGMVGGLRPMGGAQSMCLSSAGSEDLPCGSPRELEQEINSFPITSGIKIWCPGGTLGPVGWACRHVPGGGSQPQGCRRLTVKELAPGQDPEHAGSHRVGPCQLQHLPGPSKKVTQCPRRRGGDSLPFQTCSARWWEFGVSSDSSRGLLDGMLTHLSPNLGHYLI